MARVVIPGLPHHVAQRGNRRQQVFFFDEDYAAYVELMAACRAHSGCYIEEVVSRGPARPVWRFAA
jgi:putative transposase